MNSIKNTTQLGYIHCFIIATIITCLDQASKLWIKYLFSKDDIHLISINKIFNLVLSWNYGISFGIFNDPSSNKWIIILLALVLVAGLSIFIKFCSKLHRLGCSFMVGGAIGNIIDRINLGAVIDFIDFHWHRWHYPSFNIADTFIVIGAFLLLIPENKKSKTSTSLEINNC